MISFSLKKERWAMKSDSNAIAEKSGKIIVIRAKIRSK
jgi:hypothetical protein